MELKGRNALDLYNTLPEKSLSNHSEVSRNFHASNPNPQSATQKYAKRNPFVLGKFEFYNKSLGFGKENKNKKRNQSRTSDEFSIPYPFLSSFLGGSDAYKPGKRLLIYNKMSSREVHKEQGIQIMQKRRELETIRSLDRAEDK